MSSSLADVLLTSSLLYFLQKVVTEGPRFTIAGRLLRSTIANNGATALCSTIDAVLFLKLSSSWHVFPQLLLVKLYVNSLLVWLNSRQKLGDTLRGSHPQPTDFPSENRTGERTAFQPSHAEGADIETPGGFQLFDNRGGATLQSSFWGHRTQPGTQSIPDTFSIERVVLPQVPSRSLRFNFLQRADEKSHFPEPLPT